MKRLLLALIAFGLWSPAAQSAVAVMSSQQQVGNPAPSLSGVGGTVTFTAGGAAVVLDSSVTLTCTCATITGGTVNIAAGLLGLDVLNFANQNSITGSYDGGSGTLTLTGVDTLAHYVTALQSITYSSTAADPTNSGGSPTRTINWQVTNGGFNSSVSASTVAVQISAVPTISNANNSVGYVAGGSATVLDSAIVTNCTCANLTGGTITINNGFFTGDALNFTNQLGITGSYSSGVLTLTGTTTLANYTTALRTITYSSSNGDPTNGGVSSTKTVLWVVSNAGTLSAPVPTTTINVTLPGQPSWAPAGSIVAVNGQTNQAWISGTGTVGLNTQLTVTRAGPETCQGSSTVYSAIANQGCTSDNGLAIWDTYTNYVTHSVDLSDAAWVEFKSGTGATAVLGNAVIAPNGTTTAAKITISRTSTSDNAMRINASYQNGATGQYSAGIWLKADGSGDVGKTVTLHLFDSGGAARDKQYVLTSTWTYFTYNNFQMDSCASHSGALCQFGLGFSSSVGGSNPTTGTVNFDAWGAEVNTGPIAYPFIPTTTTSASSNPDNIAVAAGSALETTLKGAASTVFVTTFGGLNGSTAATILDSNGTIWLGQATSTKLTTSLGSALTTGGSTDWSAVNAPAIARDASGRTMAIGRTTVWAKDTQATTVASTIHVGSTSGTSAFFNGYVQLIVAYNSRLPDASIGVSGAGTTYYFATAGSDSANCTSTGTACQTITKANSLNYVTNDTIRFNKGDTFTGCLNLTGGGNWNATTASPGTVTNYGTGANPIITPNCTAGSAKIGGVNLNRVDGLTWDGVDVVGDAAGNAGRGISIRNCDSAAPHGTITIQNSQFTVSHDGLDADFGGGVFIDQGCNNAAQKINHISILNNIFGRSGSHPTDPMDNGLTSYGYTSSIQYDAVQGNVFQNIGGKSNGVNGSEGNAFLASGVSDPLTVQFNYATLVGGNSRTCGGPVAFMSYHSSNVTYKFNEASFVAPSPFVAGCDWDGFDADQVTDNIVFDHNYSHENYGAGFLVFGTAGTQKVMWNISNNDATSGGYAGITLQSATGAVDVLFNTFYSDLTIAGHYTVRITPTCPATLLMANNIFAQAVKDSGGSSRIVNISEGGTACTGTVNFKNNAYYFPAGSLFNRYLATGYTSLATWQAAVPGGETNATTANPTFVGPVGGSITCYTSGVPAGPQPCPAGYALQAGSTYKNTGLDVTQVPYSRTVGTTDYFGNTVPTGVGTGYPIGAAR